MRKLTTMFGLWLSVISCVCAQNTFPEEDAIWEESTFTIAGQFIRYRLLCGDTTISANNYSKIYDVLYPFDGEEIPADTMPPATYAGSLRVDGAQVYYVQPNETQELLLYDFSLEVEASIDLPNTTLGNEGTYTVTNADTVMINGEGKRRLFLENIFGQTNDVWIEGLGSVVYGLLDRGLGLVFDYGSSLHCIQFPVDAFTFRPDVNGTCRMAVMGCDLISPVIDRSAYVGEINIFPNPSRGELSLELPEDGAGWELELWNLSGQLLYTAPGQNRKSYNWSKLPPGIYLLNLLGVGLPVFSK